MQGDGILLYTSLPCKWSLGTSGHLDPLCKWTFSHGLRHVQILANWVETSSKLLLFMVPWKAYLSDLPCHYLPVSKTTVNKYTFNNLASCLKLTHYYLKSPKKISWRFLHCIHHEGFSYLPSTLISFELKLSSLARRVVSFSCCKFALGILDSACVECAFDFHLDAARPAFKVNRTGFELAPVPIPLKWANANGGFRETLSGVCNPLSTLFYKLNWSPQAAK